MFDGLFFFTYIFAGFVGFLVILLAVLLARYWTSGNKHLLSAIRNFMICTALIDALYFYIDYTVLKTGLHAASPFIRVFDIFTYVGQVFFWSSYIREKSRFSENLHKNMMRTSLILCITCLAVSFISYGFIMDGYYFALPGIHRTLCLVMEIFVSAVLTFITLWHLKKGLSNLIQNHIRFLISTISFFITANGLWNAFLVVSIMTDHLDFQKVSFANPTSLFIFMINLLTIILVWKEDFTALFRLSEKEQPAENHTEKRLDRIAQDYALTEREREVLELAYEGLTNPEIADQLIISKYTVKRHMHNIFEKLDISTRIELIHLVNQEDGPHGPL